jgi:hypothetical protein
MGTYDFIFSAIFGGNLSAMLEVLQLHADQFFNVCVCVCVCVRERERERERETVHADKWQHVTMHSRFQWY